MAAAYETEAVEHEGRTFEVKYKPVIECEHCGNTWATQSTARRPSCSNPDCRRKTDRNEVGGYYEDITRYSLLSFTEDTEVTGELVVGALRQRADKYEAMLANGWELLGTGNQSSVWFVKGDVNMEPPVE